MRRKYTYSKKVSYIFSISQKDLRRCEGSPKDLYTPLKLSLEIAEERTHLNCHLNSNWNKCAGGRPPPLFLL